MHTYIHAHIHTYAKCLHACLLWWPSPTLEAASVLETQELDLKGILPLRFSMRRGGGLRDEAIADQPIVERNDPIFMTRLQFHLEYIIPKPTQAR